MKVFTAARRSSALAITFAAVAVLAGCTSGPDTPAVTPAESSAAAAPATPSGTPTAEEVAERTGTRTAPLAIGESRKLADDSAWTVSVISSNLDGAAEVAAGGQFAPEPAAGETFVIAKVAVSVDGKALTAQGIDLANDGAQPWQSLQITYVAADGSTSFDGTSGTSCYTQSNLYDQGAVYQDAAVVTGDVCIAVPTANVPGGLWRISNLVNDNVWIMSS